MSPLFFKSLFVDIPYQNCIAGRDSVREPYVTVSLIREISMESAGIHRAFVKEYNNDVIYYGESVELNGMSDSV